MPPSLQNLEIVQRPRPFLVFVAAWTLSLAICAVAAPVWAEPADDGKPDAVYIAERIPNVVVAGCVLREEREQGVWRFLREADLSAIAQDRVEYVRGEDGRYAFILRAPLQTRPIRILQEKDGRVMSEHFTDAATFVSNITDNHAAETLYRRARRLVEQCAARNGTHKGTAP